MKESHNKIDNDDLDQGSTTEVNNTNAGAVANTQTETPSNGVTAPGLDQSHNSEAPTPTKKVKHKKKKSKKKKSKKSHKKKSHKKHKE